MPEWQLDIKKINFEVILLSAGYCTAPYALSRLSGTEVNDFDIRKEYPIYCIQDRQHQWNYDSNLMHEKKVKFKAFSNFVAVEKLFLYQYTMRFLKWNEREILFPKHGKLIRKIKITLLCFKNVEFFVVCIQPVVYCSKKTLAVWQVTWNPCVFPVTDLKVLGQKYVQRLVGTSSTMSEERQIICLLRYIWAKTIRKVCIQTTTLR